MHFLSGISLSVDAAGSGHAYAMQTHAVTQTQLLTGVWLAVDCGEHCELHDGWYLISDVSCVEVQKNVRHEENINEQICSQSPVNLQSNTSSCLENLKGCKQFRPYKCSACKDLTHQLNCIHALWNNNMF